MATHRWKTLLAVTGTAALVSVGLATQGAASAAVPAEGARAAALICPHEVKWLTPRYLNWHGQDSNGGFAEGSIVSIYQGEIRGNRLRTAGGYWMYQGALGPRTGACRS